MLGKSSQCEIFLRPAFRTMISLSPMSSGIVRSAKVNENGISGHFLIIKSNPINQSDPNDMRIPVPGFFSRGQAVKRYLLLFMLLFLSTGLLPVLGQNEISIEDDLSYPFLEKLIATARSNYPRGQAYESRVELAEKGIKKARLSYFDIFSFSYLFSPFNRTPALNPNMLTGYQFGFFANVGSLLQKPTQIRQARDELEIIEKEKEVYELGLDADVKRRYFTYVKAKTLYRVLTQSVLDADAMVEDIKYRFEKEK